MPTESADDSRKIYERRLTREVKNVDIIIDNINEITAGAIKTLQEQKEVILQGTKLAKEIQPEQLDERIEDITKKTEVVHGKYERIIERKMSLNLQSEKILELDRQIEVLEKDRDEEIKVFLEKKEYLQERIRSIQAIDINIEGLEFKAQFEPIVDEGEITEKEKEFIGETEGTNLKDGIDGKDVDPIGEGGRKQILDDEGSEEGIEDEEDIFGRDDETTKLIAAMQKYTDPLINGRFGTGDVCVCTSSTSETSFTSTSESEGPSADCLYLQETVGVALKIALSEIFLKKPRDPIRYLGHFLLKFRLNQEQDTEKVKEFTNLMHERIRLENKKLHDMFLNEAQAAMLEMIVRAENEIIRRHLEALGEEEEDQNSQVLTSPI